MTDYSSDSSNDLEKPKNIRSKTEEENPKPVRLNKNGKPRKPLTEKQKEALSNGRKKAHERKKVKEEKVKEIIENNKVVDKINNTKYNKNQKEKQHIEKAVEKVVRETKKPKKKVIIYESSSSEEEEIVYKKKKKKPPPKPDPPKPDPPKPDPPKPDPPKPSLRFIRR